MLSKEYWRCNSKWKQTNWQLIVETMLKSISQVYENHSNNHIKFIVHLLIRFGRIPALVVTFCFFLVIRKMGIFFLEQVTCHYPALELVYY